MRAAVDAVSEQRIRANIETLVGFGVRDATVRPDDLGSPIGAAGQWIAREFASYSPRLEVRIRHRAEASGRAVHNVVAELPGMRTPEQQVLVTAHYDSRVGVGAADNASGTAAMMEVARVLSAHSFDKALVFIAFSSEEYGITGSRLEAEAAKRSGAKIEAVLNADIVGNDPAPEGEVPKLDV